MAAGLSDTELGDAILQNVKNGAYPESEDIASADLPANALRTILALVEQAREDVKTEIRTLSRGTAPDIDGWIAQAKQLQADIERSKATAHDIIQQAEAGKALKAHVDDAASKVGLLEAELSFNETLTSTLERIQSICNLLDKAQDDAVHDHASQALDWLQEANSLMAHLEAFENTRFIGILRERATQLRAAIVEDATECWNALVAVDFAEWRITIKDEIQRESPINVNLVIEALNKLDILDKTIGRLSRDFDTVILGPRLSLGYDQVLAELTINGDEIRTSGRTIDASAMAVLEDVRRIIEFLSTRLPPAVSLPLSEKLMPLLLPRLIPDWLEPSVPTSLEEIPAFQNMLTVVTALADYLGELGWAGRNELIDWVDSAPRIWLSKRREASLASVRQSCFRDVKRRKTVERVETEMVSHSDVIAGAGTNNDDWEAGWSEEAGANEAPSNIPKESMDEEDVSAWGLEEDEPQPSQEASGKGDGELKAPEENEDEAWGWGDEDMQAQDAPAASKPAQVHRPLTNGGPKRTPSTQREITLKETYTVTAIPDTILELIVQIVSDAERLAQPEYSETAIAPAAMGVYSVPTLMLAMYRATAATYYAIDIAGNMLIYNDCNRLSDILRSYLQALAEKSPTIDIPASLKPSNRLKLDTDIKPLESFAKRAYGREMESQRTILRDLLDGAQGFANCTVPPFAAECENAVAMTADRIREVNRQWKDVLSRSVLLQSLGSLLSTVVSKIIMEVEEMSDISEEESKRLRHFCNEITTLSDLFLQESPNDAPSDMTGVYTPNWFKFQYLSEILESSLADIKYLWTEGELKLEFRADEVIDLIEALFAESEHRRRAIQDIKKTSIHL